MNFYDSENQIYKKIASNYSGSRKLSKYKFSGRFRVIRDLRKFPFDKGQLKISLTSLIGSPDINLSILDVNIREDQWRFGAFVALPQCYEENMSQNPRDNVCGFIKLKPQSTVPKDDQSIEILSNDLFYNIELLDFRPVLNLETTFFRVYSSSFFRYIFPLLAGIIVLILTDNLSKRYQDIKVATAPTVLLTFIFMQNGYQTEIPQLSYLTYMDKLYFLSYFLAILQLSNALVDTNSRNRINRFTKKYLKITFNKFARRVFAFSTVLGPFILF